MQNYPIVNFIGPDGKTYKYIQITNDFYVPLSKKDNLKEIFKDYNIPITED